MPPPNTPVMSPAATQVSQMSFAQLSGEITDNARYLQDEINSIGEENLTTTGRQIVTRARGLAGTLLERSQALNEYTHGQPWGQTPIGQFQGGKGNTG